MKKIINLMLCLTLLLTMAAPAYAGETGSEPSSATITEHVCSFTIETITIEATCTAPGTKTLSCSCGKSRTEEIAAKGHSYGAASKVDDKDHKSICSACQAESVSAHTWDGGTETTKATCQQDGVKTYTCTACSAEKTETIQKTGIHSWSKTDSAAEHSCSVCGVKENHSFKEEITKQPTCKKDGNGSKKKYCSVCGYSETIVLPKLTTHTYDSACDPECNVCGRQREIEHTFTKVWSKGYDGHWHECTKCGEKADFSKHIAGPAATEEKDQVCTVCSYVITARKEHKHTYETQWTSDKVGHWHACTGKTCTMEKDYGAHVFDNDCDPDCNTCGYERENSHSYDTEGWQTTNFEHWNICSACGEESKHEKHVPGPEASEDNAQVCTVCNYELAPKLEHTHDFGPEYIGNDENHWQECECGELSVPEAHVWDAGTKTGKKTMTYRCTLCAEEKTEAVSSGFPWLTVVLVILALICIGGIVVLAIMLKRGVFDDEEDEQEEAEDDEKFSADEEADEEDKMIDDFFASLDE